MSADANPLANRPIVDHDAWLAARRALLDKEKALTRLRDDLSRERRELPWELVEKPYSFDGASGRRALADLFDGRSQLLVYHFMFDPKSAAGCPHCSHVADTFNGIVIHLNQRDVTLVAVSRAPYAKIEAYRRRMGWTFTWVSSFESDFNFDYYVSFTPEALATKRATYNFVEQDPGGSEREAVSVFARGPDGRVFHTYSAYARGIEVLIADYQYLDLVPKGRDESGRGPFWVRRHDEYT
jgi:predicted dithiol-disulfide oxidoreductase (DUF899 family)